jgi:hypothetical protein
MHDPVRGPVQSLTFGPWASDIPETERHARLRELRALAHVLAGPRHPFTTALRSAIGDPSAVDRASKALADLPTRTMRRLLSTYAALNLTPLRRR